MHIGGVEVVFLGDPFVTAVRAVAALDELSRIQDTVDEPP
jgi:hypothetical protein